MIFFNDSVILTVKFPNSMNIYLIKKTIKGDDIPDCILDLFIIKLEAIMFALRLGQNIKQLQIQLEIKNKI